MSSKKAKGKGKSKSDGAKKKRGKGAALARADHGKADRLTREQHAVFAEALQRANRTREVIEHEVIDLGQWLLVKVFDDDAGAALGDTRKNVVWKALVERAGGPTLRLSEKVLSVALHIAAHDKRIQDDSWRLLDQGRKELLLPLKEEPVMRKAAQHVIDMKLSQDATKVYVAALRSDLGKPVTRRVSLARMRNQLGALRARVTDDDFTKRLQQALDRAPRGEKAELRRELEGLRTWFSRMIGVLM
jgi:hypothetical protein